MKFASTRLIDGVEVVGVTLPLAQVPNWNSEDPLPNTYLVGDEVQVGWAKNPDGTFSARPPTAAEIETLRKAAYREESDPIFFKWQRGEATEAQWLAAVAAIKTRYPQLV